MQLTPIFICRYAIYKVVARDCEVYIRPCVQQKLPTYANQEEADYTFKIIAVGDALYTMKNLNCYISVTHIPRCW